MHLVQATSPTNYTDGEEWQEAEEEVEELGRERVAYRYYSVDATITLRPTSGQSFTLWEPGELSLASPNTNRINPDDDDFGVVEKVKIWNNGEWQDDEGLKYDGPLRIQLHVGIPPEADRARFRYYFEVFGQINFQGDITSDVFSESR